MRDSEPTISRRDFAIATGTGLVAASLPGATKAQESTPAPAPLVEYYDVTGWVHPFAVGEFECLAVSDSSSLNNDPNDPFNFFDLVFGTSPPAELQAVLDAAGYDRGNVIRQDTFVLVQTGSQVVLIDTGIGAGLGGALVSNLKGAGIEPGDIDVVITTHGHPDHIGGNVDETGAPTFPNARYVMSEKEWEFWADSTLVERAYPNPAISGGVLAFANAQLVPIADQYDLIGFDEEIVPGITSLESPGHTPGHMSLIVQSGNEQVWVAGDFAAHPLDIPNPWISGYADVDPEILEATRTRLYQRLADEGSLAIFGHFDPFPGLGHVSADGNAWVWEPLPGQD